MSFSSIKIQSVSFVRHKRLKGGRIIARCIRTLSTGFKTTVEGVGAVKTVLVEFDSKFVSGSMTGHLNTITGQLYMRCEDVVPEGYLKNKRFKLIGYMPQVNMTNVNRRERSLEIKAKRSKSPQQGPVKKGFGR